MGNYWTTFKDRKSRLRDRAEPPPPPPPSVQGRERQTPPTLIVEEEENDSNNKARAKKKVDKPQEDEVESLLDGRYWQTTSNSRRALREKKRAREAQLDSQGEKRAKFDDVEVLIDLVQDEEEEENEDDGEEEKDEEKDEEIESDVEEPSFAPPSVRNLEPPQRLAARGTCFLLARHVSRRIRFGRHLLVSLHGFAQRIRLATGLDELFHVDQGKKAFFLFAACRAL
jgi:hypothetical protein